MLAAAPVAGSLARVRSGVRRAARELSTTTVAIVDGTDMEGIGDLSKRLYEEAECAWVSMTEIVCFVVSGLRDLAEYLTFQDICLPEHGQDRIPERKTLWTTELNTAVSRHFASTGIMRVAFRSCPRWRDPGHDYCEDMLVCGCRVLLRPAMVRFARRVEKVLGWPSVERSGILHQVQLRPKRGRGIQ